MNKEVGLWIDRQRAVILFIEDGVEKTMTVTADIEGQTDGNARMADNILQRKETKELNTYYDEVISAIGDADPIYIIGPAEAKGELHKRMESTMIGDRSITVETADSMTDPQIAAMIRTHFSPAS